MPFVEATLSDYVTIDVVGKYSRTCAGSRGLDEKLSGVTNGVVAVHFEAALERDELFL